MIRPLSIRHVAETGVPGMSEVPLGNALSQRAWWLNMVLYYHVEGLNVKIKRNPAVLWRAFVGVSTTVKMGVFSEPCSWVFEIGDNAGNCFPEFRAMVFFFDMRQFVDDDIIDDSRRQQGDAPGKIEIVLGAARAPSGFCAIDSD
jgi:hypothetical protein